MSIPKSLFSKINSALDDRSGWEQKQLDWYKLRYEGYGRPSMPYPNAPDVHYPLADIAIEKLKPFYIQQIYGQERLATFIDTSVGLDASVEGVSHTIAEDELRFDSEVKQRSNFEKSAHVFVDKMLHYGVHVVKTMWGKNDQLLFSPVDAMHMIVPPGTASLQDADDWLVHVIRLSEKQYRANPKFEKSTDIIKRIKGRGAQGKGGTDEKQQQIDAREGITGTEYEDQIVLWEVYHKESPSDKQWTVSTVSPLAGYGTRLCKDFKLPYTNGVFAEGAHPFSDFSYESATEGFYSPRGIAEILEPFELSLCKSWNFKLQFMDYNGQPTFFVNSPMANMANFTNRPGSVRPFGIERDKPMDAPLDFMQEMQMTRALAEDRVSIPDLGNQEHLTGQEGKTGQVTATQIRAVVGLSNQSNDLRSRIFKGQLAVLYRKAWDIISQYRKLEPKKAIIVPSGSADQWNKEMRVQKMLALFQMLTGRPNVDQDELLKILLEQDSPDLVKRLFRDSGAAAADEAEKEADAITKMLIGFPVQVHGDEDAAARITTLAQFVERRLQTKEPITPEFARLALGRGAAFEQLLQQKKDPRAPQLAQTLAPIVAVLQHIAAQPAQPPPDAPPGTPDGTPHTALQPESNNAIPTQPGPSMANSNP